MLDNYPTGFDLRLLDGKPDIDDLPQKYQMVNYAFLAEDAGTRLVVTCGEDSQEVFSQLYATYDEMKTKGIPEAERAVARYQDEMLELSIEEGEPELY